MWHSSADRNAKRARGAMSVRTFNSISSTEVSDCILSNISFWLWWPRRPRSSLLSQKASIKSVGPARVIAGEYDGVESMVSSPEDLTYLDVRLRAGIAGASHRPRATTSGESPPTKALCRPLGLSLTKPSIHLCTLPRFA
jgi:hypothetical protein